MANQPLVSIILLNWNQVAVTEACLESLRKLTYSNVEVIVVEQASTDGSSARLKANYPQARVVDAGRNLGFTGGCNLGMRVARGDFFLLLNNDTEVDAGFLEPLVSAILQRATAGAACPKIRYFSAPDTIQYAGGIDVNPFTGRGGFVGTGEVDRGQHDQLKVTALAHGAAFFVSREAVEQVGVLFEDYFVYYEELDWSLRLREAGWDILYVPQSLVLHKESITIGKSSPRKTYMMTRNRVWFVRRRSGALAAGIFMGYFALLAMPLNAARLLLSGRFAHLSSFLRGAWHGLTYPSKALRREVGLHPAGAAARHEPVPATKCAVTG